MLLEVSLSEKETGEGANEMEWKGSGFISILIASTILVIMEPTSIIIFAIGGSNISYLFSLSNMPSLIAW